MPELPEVETIRLGLQKYIVGVKPRGGHATIRGKTIEDVEIKLPKIISGNPKDIIGAKVVDVRRFGKGLVIDLNNGYSIAIHTKLTGQLIYRGPDIPTNVHLSPKIGGVLPNKWTHVIFKLKSPAKGEARQGWQKSNLKSTRFAEASARRASQSSKLKNGEDAYLYYNDLRQFGWIKIIRTDEIQKLPFFKELGPEFLNNLTMKQFSNIVSSSNSSIKPLIMDQKKMSGVGNIYANDGLFEAKIDPRKKAKSLSEIEIKKLFDAILKVLKKGLENGGASELNYVNALGQEGKYQHHFLAYARDGEKCLRCGAIMKKITLSGRGTYFCANCQK